jgi:hypothetical protein
MKSLVLSICIVAVLLDGCATTNQHAHQHAMKINSVPSGALISIHETREPSNEDTRKVAGTTPLEESLDFPVEGNRLWLEIDKRGYVPQWVQVTPETETLTVRLERAKDKTGQPVKEYAFPVIKRLLLVPPDFAVVERGFSSEKVSESESAEVKASLAKGTQTHFRGKYEVVQIPYSQDNLTSLKSVWRDGRAAMELVDPIRLKYLPTPEYLETRAAREAARRLGSRYGGEALLLLAGKQNRETAGMVLGKIGLGAAGTFASYVGAYNNAVARGDSSFVYTIYAPSFAKGTFVEAALIDCASGEILWVNKGAWGALQLDNPEERKMLTTDLFSGLN